jgi:hypothetical protein
LQAGPYADSEVPELELRDITRRVRKDVELHTVEAHVGSVSVTTLSRLSC